MKKLFSLYLLILAIFLVLVSLGELLAWFSGEYRLPDLHFWQVIWAPLKLAFLLGIFIYIYEKKVRSQKFWKFIFWVNFLNLSYVVIYEVMWAKGIGIEMFSSWAFMALFFLVITPMYYAVYQVGHSKFHGMNN